jgi:hypothetical protein
MVLGQWIQQDRNLLSGRSLPVAPTELNGRRSKRDQGSERRGGGLPNNADFMLRLPSWAHPDGQPPNWLSTFRGRQPTENRGHVVKKHVKPG